MRWWRAASRRDKATFVSPPLPFARFDEFLAKHQSKALADEAVREAARVVA